MLDEITPSDSMSQINCDISDAYSSIDIFKGVFSDTSCHSDPPLTSNQEIEKSNGEEGE